MKRLIQFLIGLYPPEWRARYGDELRALLEDSSPKASTAFDLLKGALVMHFSSGAFPKQALLLSMTGMLIGGASSYLMPNMYQATAVMTVRPRRGSEDPVAGQEVKRQYEELIQEMTAMVMSRQSLAMMMSDPHLDLYRKERQNEPLEAVEDRMRSHTQVLINAGPPQPGKSATVFAIRFTYPDRRKAHDAVQMIVTRFIDVSTQIALARKFDRGYLELIDPPRVGDYPVSPNRGMVAAAGFVGGFLIAALMAIVRMIRGTGPSTARFESGA